MLSSLFSGGSSSRTNPSAVRNEESSKYIIRAAQGVNDLSIDRSGELMALGR